MAIPEIPSQMVAKLVLGYLAEEQLMTAYDEFLQSSPYLDAQQNEYDRIFMTSLNHIVAEYRALRIQVEMCQPVALRRQLLQFQNLADMVKFLINNVDLQKLGLHTVKPNNSQSLNPHHVAREKEIDQFRHKKDLPVHQDSFRQSTSNFNQTGKHLNSLVETTSLADLPGNNSKLKKKKTIRVNDKNTTAVSPFNIASDREAIRVKQQQSCPPSEHNRSHLEGSVQNACSLSFKPHSVNESRHSSEHNSVVTVGANTVLSRVNTTERLSSGTFQDFASGVSGGTQVNINIPDSSTTENLNSQVKQNEAGTPSYSHPTKKTQYLIQVNTPNGLTLSNDRRIEESRIKIISDMILDDPASRLLKASTLPNATSTPAAAVPGSVAAGSMTAGSVTAGSVTDGSRAGSVVSGSGGRRPRTDKPLAKRAYTKDEIMAMPTIILVPTSGPPPASVVAQPIKIQPLLTAASAVGPGGPGGPGAPGAPAVGDVSLSSAGTAASLEPLTIDIADSPTAPAVNAIADPKNSTVPKDSVVSIVGKTSTPQVLPLTRKSSSTPRRTSHVRVLDFATPRRILHGTIQENEPQNEVLISRSPNLVINEPQVQSEDDATKENQPQTSKKTNWDAELRALVGTTMPHNDKTPKPKTKRSMKKKKPPEKEKDSIETPKTAKKIAKRLSLKTSAKKKPKSKDNSKETIIEVEDDTEALLEAAVKPTINIITEWKPSPPKEDKSADKSAEVSENKSNSEQQSDTPEMDRLSLQNAMGAKLNISDLLETPYKQALYDIQMETPRFLRPDIPGSEPVSEVKIGDIPTPRFLCSPGTGGPVAQATPGSYCSRPTDYSSGGSYYKPDDAPDLDCFMTATVGPAVDLPPAETKSSRPVRKCTKNVSYCNAKAKTVENNEDLDNSNDTEILDVTGDITDVDAVESNSNSSAVKVNKSKSKESKKKSTAAKKGRPPKKVSPNKFMKIKPRRPTPVKLNRSKSKKDGSSPAKRKRTSSKVKTGAESTSATPAPTKSRRKSSTPRKLHTKVFSSESLDTNSSGYTNRGKEMNKFTASNVQDSDTENLPLRWSDDCSRGSAEPAAQNKVSPANCSTNDVEDITKIRAFIESTVNSSEKSIPIKTYSRKKDVPDGRSANEIEDINKIRAYIESTVSNTNIISTSIEQAPQNKSQSENCSANEIEDINKIRAYIENTVNNASQTPIAIEEESSSFHIDLVERGFDIETAKSIERDLLDACPVRKIDAPLNRVSFPVQVLEVTPSSSNVDKNKLLAEASEKSGVTPDGEMNQSDDEEEVEFSIHECNDETANNIVCEHDANTNKSDPVLIKDTFSMEICLEDEVVRLKATQFTSLLDEEPETYHCDSLIETEAAVSSIASMDRLYTPLKDQRAAFQAQCIEIFDSTLTSLDTPLKSNSPKRKDVSITELVELTVEKEVAKDKASKKRKRAQTSPDTASDNKKNKKETRYLPNIQNFDIDTVLSKLHGP